MYSNRPTVSHILSIPPSVSWQDVFLPGTDCKDVYLLEAWRRETTREFSSVAISLRLSPWG